MKKTVPNANSEVLILSIGLNNQDQDPQQTSCKQLKAPFKQETVTFPNSDIFFPIMNFSTNLTLKQKSNLTLINTIMATHFPFLTEIPHDDFTTEPDNIHWKLITDK